MIKIVLVTGSSGSIGNALCKEFKDHNAIVYRTDIVPKNMPGFIPGDISDLKFIRNLIGQIVFKEGRIDILINNALICSNTPPGN